MPTEAENKRQAARDVIDILEDISKILVGTLSRCSVAVVPRKVAIDPLSACRARRCSRV